MPKTYGKIWLKDSTWHVQCEPHVMVRLKRTFDKVRKDQYDTVTLADSPEMCRELQWFTLRFPLSADEPTQFYLEEQAEKHEREEREVYQLLSGEVEPKDFKLRLPLRPYQRVATDLALKTGGLLIADEMGLGKSPTAIGMFTDQRTRPALVATLAHLTYQWEAEIHRFAPELTTHIIKQGKFYPFTKDETFPDILITSYYKLHAWASHLAGKIRCIIFDEVQELRHGTLSLKGSAAFHISDQASFRCGLSGTPFHNYGAEMFNVMKALRPGVLGTFSEFAREWLSWDNKKLKDPKAFGTYLRNHGYMIRRTREDVQRKLPVLTKVPHWIDFDFEALDKLKSSADELALSIVRHDATISEEEQKDKFARENEFKQILRQATGIGKAPYVAEFVRMLLESGEQVVLYLWHRESYNIVLDRLKEYKPAMYTGSESPQRKRKQFNRFVRKETPLLLISLRSGAGLDGLQYHCRTVVFGELDWSPAVHEQCCSRVYRDGQLDDVTAYFLLAKGGSDPYVSELLGIKRAQIEGVKDPEGAVLPNYDLDNVSVKELALNYMKQRQPEKEIEIMAPSTVRRKLEGNPLENKGTNITAYLTGDAELDLVESLGHHLRYKDVESLIDKEMLVGMLKAMGLKPSKKLHQKLINDLCNRVLKAAGRAKLNDRTVVKTHDL